MEVLAVGLPRSATESLKEALLILGYEDCYHGYNLVFDRGYRAKWANLVRQKHFPTCSSWLPMPKARSEPLITTEEFDAVLGHCRAVTDSPASAFAFDLIHAYPDAKVILNQRKDLDRWTASLTETVVRSGKNPLNLLLVWFNADLWWMYNIFYNLIYPAHFQYLYGTFDDSVAGKAKSINREHSAMVRGAIAPERLLEWSVDEGWEPLCKFLGKDVPDVPFPSVNAGAAYIKRTDSMVRGYAFKSLRNMVAALVVSGGVIYYCCCR